VGYYLPPLSVAHADAKQQPGAAGAARADMVGFMADVRDMSVATQIAPYNIHVVHQVSTLAVLAAAYDCACMCEKAGGGGGGMISYV
jgi:hypothetical protein